MVNLSPNFLLQQYKDTQNSLIKKFIDEVFKASNEVDLLIIDDNSPDQTGELLQNLQKTLKNFMLHKNLK